MIYTYESVIILDDKLTETGYNDTIKSTQDYLIDHVSKLKKTDKLGKKKLAYPIKRDKRECKDGWYAVFTFQTNPDFILEWERMLRVDDRVLKFITVKHEDEEEYDADTTVSESEQQPDVKPDASNIDLFDLIFNYDTHLTFSQDCDIISKKKGVK